MASCHLTPACNPTDRMLISIRRLLSDCSLNISIADLAGVQLSDWRVGVSVALAAVL